MAQPSIAAAVQRVITAFARHPDLAVHDDVPATARWQSGTRMVVRNPNGIEVLTDMPAELGGSADQVTPGWLFRASVASCAATSITLAAAVEGIALQTLQVQVGSRSDARGLLGMSDSDGQAVHAGPLEVSLHITVHAPGTDPAALRALVEGCLSHSPIPSALRTATPYSLHIHTEPA